MYPYVHDGSGTIIPEEDCPPTPKLTLTVKQFSSGAIVRLPFMIFYPLKKVALFQIIFLISEAVTGGVL